MVLLFFPAAYAEFGKHFRKEANAQASSHSLLFLLEHQSSNANTTIAHHTSDDATAITHSFVEAYNPKVSEASETRDSMNTITWFREPFQWSEKGQKAKEKECQGENCDKDEANEPPPDCVLCQWSKTGTVLVGVCIVLSVVALCIVLGSLARNAYTAREQN